MKWIFSGVGSLISLVAAFHFAGIRYNVSESYPSGLYQVHKDKFPATGDLALFCLPESETTALAKERFYLKDGFCESGTLPLTKRLVGIPGDLVESSTLGISVNNGPVIKNTQRRLEDSYGRALPQFPGGELSNDMYFLVSDHNPKSWDSRYFGPVHGRHIIGAVTPFFIWGE